MPLLNEEIAEQVKQELADLAGPVRLAMFTQEFECRFCAETRQLVEEIVQLSDQLTAEVYNFVTDEEKAEELGIDKIPAIAVIGAEDYGVRFFGIPSGYEFMSLLDSIKTVSAGEVELMPETLAFLEELEEPLHIQVFVTPNCPYCPGAATTAYTLAQESPLIRADVVEAIEFPHLANKYGVRGVPMVVINETTSFVGNRPASFFVEQILTATKQANGEEGE